MCANRQMGQLAKLLSVCTKTCPLQINEGEFGDLLVYIINNPDKISDLEDSLKCDNDKVKGGYTIQYVVNRICLTSLFFCLSNLSILLLIVKLHSLYRRSDQPIACEC